MFVASAYLVNTHSLATDLPQESLKVLAPGVAIVAQAASFVTLLGQNYAY